MNIFGVKIQTHSREDTWQRIHHALRSDAFHRVTTLNPEFLLQAYEDTKFRENLNRADIQTIDGGGLRLAFWRAHKVWPGRITGHQLVNTLCRASLSNLTPAPRQNDSVGLASLSKERGLPPHPSPLLRQERGNAIRIGIIANQAGLSQLEEIIEALRKKYPGLECAGISVPQQTTSFRELLPEQLATLQSCTIIFCNLSAPNQEYLLESLREHPGHIRLVIGVGGVFDTLTGKIKQAPRWISKVGLEWLWRLLQQPRRFRRIFRAVVIFPGLISFETSF